MLISSERLLMWKDAFSTSCVLTFVSVEQNGTRHCSRLPNVTFFQPYASYFLVACTFDNSAASNLVAVEQGDARDT